MNGVYAPHFEVGDYVLLTWIESMYGKPRQYLVVGNKHINYSLADLLTGELITPPQETLRDLQEIIQNDIDSGRIKYIQVF